jgi:hypothetical protein
LGEEGDGASLYSAPSRFSSRREDASLYPTMTRSSSSRRGKGAGETVSPGNHQENEYSMAELRKIVISKLRSVLSVNSVEYYPGVIIEKEVLVQILVHSSTIDIKREVPTRSRSFDVSDIGIRGGGGRGGSLRGGFEDAVFGNDNTASCNNNNNDSPKTPPSERKTPKRAKSIDELMSMRGGSSSSLHHKKKSSSSSSHSSSRSPSSHSNLKGSSSSDDPLSITQFGCCIILSITQSR